MWRVIDHGGGLPEPDRLERAKELVMDLLNERLAVVKPEAIARLGEGYHRGDPRNMDPHITGRALRELSREGRLITPEKQTRGRSLVETIQPAEQKGRATAIEQAARRKRLIYARYRGWATGTKRHPHGIIGPAGEAAVRLAIQGSSTILPSEPGAGEVSTILGVTLNGPADSGGYMIPLVAGVPQAPVTVLIEVKSIREWIYPNSTELYQVLHKCMLLKQAHPNTPVVPILVCRRAHKTAFWMAQQLGFLILEMGAQFVGSSVTEDELREVRNELGFSDLYLGNGPALRVGDRLAKTSSVIADYATTWTATSQDPEIPSILSTLRTPHPAQRRVILVNELRDINNANGNRGGW